MTLYARSNNRVLSGIPQIQIPKITKKALYISKPAIFWNVSKMSRPVQQWGSRPKGRQDAQGDRQVLEERR